jgi:hypothetical protein
MTTTNIDPELNNEEELTETSKIPPVAQKVSKFGNAGFGGSSQFGK